jgi:hypothetical protein
MSEKLPTGVWYDAPNRRYRVRRYKNRVPYLVGYFTTLEEALAAHAQLSVRLASVKRRQAGERVAASAPATTFFAFARAALSDAAF